MVLDLFAFLLTFIVSLMSCDCECFVTLSHGAVDRSAVCGCCISRSYSLTLFLFIQKRVQTLPKHNK